MKRGALRPLLGKTLAALSGTMISGAVWAGYQLNLREPQSDLARDVYNMHTLINLVCLAIFVVVFGAMFYSIWKHRKSAGHQAEHFHENTTVEVIWTVIPFLILIGMAYPATKTVLAMKDTSNPDMTIKVTGYQWKWQYEYLGTDVGFYSTLAHESNAARQLQSGIDPRSVPNYLLDVDNPLVVPAGTKVRLLLTAQDVIHSWWVPDFGMKKDAIPGVVNEMWIKVDADKTGRYRGQCAELCGRDHGFMPVVVDVMSREDFESWLAARKTAQQQAALAANRNPSIS